MSLAAGMALIITYICETTLEQVIEFPLIPRFPPLLGRTLYKMIVT